MQLLESWYQNVDVPVQLIWGNCDPTLPVHLGYKIAAQLPNARLTILPDCKHAPNLECPEACARLIRQAEVALRSQSRAVSQLGSIPTPDSRVTVAQIQSR